MQITKTEFEDITIIKPETHHDFRGEFQELYNVNSDMAMYFPNGIQQVSRSRSGNNVFRGMHFQYAPRMSKAIRVISGIAYFFHTDLRILSETFLKTQTTLMTPLKGLIYSPWYYAVGFLSADDNTEIEYFHDATYNPTTSLAIRYNDPEIRLKLPRFFDEVILSDRDRDAPTVEKLFTDTPISQHFMLGNRC